jgi:D-alanyl-D-alanine dipeptidase
MSYEERILRARAAAGEAGLAGLLLPPSPDLVYLTGYDPPPLERLTMLIVRPGDDPVLVVPELERPMALASPMGGRLEVVGWRDAVDPYELVASFVPRAARLGVGDRMWASHLLGLERFLAARELVATSAAVPLLRAVKDADELGRLELAGRGADEAFDEALEFGFLDATEAEIGERLASLLRAHAHDDVNFTIVGSGPNGASPHHVPTDRRIARGDPVVLDFGGRAQGYCSDITRTIVVEAPTPEIREAHEVVREAQEAAYRAVRPGVPAEDVDRAAREIIEAAGYGESFVHRTGHGIGLEEHEPPYIVRGNAEPLRPGMCFSIEPGIYVEGRFGVRIEDIVAVTEGGAIRFNEARRDLLEVV